MNSGAGFLLGTQVSRFMPGGKPGGVVDVALLRVGPACGCREPHPGSSRREPILVDKTAELVRSSQSRRIGTTDRQACPLQSERSALGKGAVRPMLVVVRDELTKNCLELTTMNHEQSVKTLPAHGADDPVRAENPIRAAHATSRYS